jgi:hypothetical protein
MRSRPRRQPAARRAAAAILLAGLAAAGAAAARTMGAARWTPRVGAAMPTLPLRALSGEALSLEKRRGEAVWLAFFHSS